MFRDVPSYRHLIEMSHSGREEEEALLSRVAAAHLEDFAADGIEIDVVGRGVVPGQTMITVGGGAEAQAVKLVEWIERNGAPGRVDVYIHPHSLPRPVFFLLPKEAVEAKRQLRWIASARERLPEGTIPPSTGRRLDSAHRLRHVRFPG